MENGQASSGTIDILRDYVKSGEKVPAKLRDELLFGALVELFDIAKRQGEAIKEIRPWISGFKWGVLLLGSAVLLLLFGMLTHTIAWPNF